MRIPYTDAGLEQLTDIIANAHVSGISDEKLSRVIDAAEKIDAYLRAEQQDTGKRARIRRLEAQEAKIDALLVDGWPELEARSYVTGRSMTALRREEYRALVGDHSTPFRELVAREYQKLAQQEHDECETTMRAHMVKAEYHTKIDPMMFWLLKDNQALKAIKEYASDEMVAYFAEKGRPTPEQYLRSIVHGEKPRIFDLFLVH